MSLVPTPLLQRSSLLAVVLALVAAAAAAQPPIPSASDDGSIRATRLTEPLVLDGRLSEGIYSSTTPFGGFIQQEPDEGAPATERTDAWLFFDDRNIYVAARCEDSQPDRQIANEMRRDGQSINDNESFAVVLDTFHDRRNGFLFQVSLAGGLFDAYITDERDMNRDWNTVWDARTSRDERGWSVEMIIPFKSLRFRPGDTQVWGVNFKRVVRWKNETQYLTQVPAAMGRRAIVKLSSAATMVGVEPPTTRRNFEVKPYGIGGVTADRPATGENSTDAKKDAGFDVKLGITDGLTADFTYNTDFAQVEEDEQQVNLTRFSVLFPEKRDFFLEGQGIFYFGGQGGPRGGGGGGNPNSLSNPMTGDVPVLFFSRRIGLNNGVQVPIDVGGRLTGKAGAYSIGVIDIRTAEDEVSALPATNFGVVRVKRDVFRRSAVGIIYNERSQSSSAEGASRAYGVDGVFSFFENLNFNTYFAKTDTPGGSGRDTSYRTQLDYNGDRYGVQLERLALDERFTPDMGFLRRSAFIRNSTYLRFSPRPRSMPSVRKFSIDGQADYITSPSGQLETRTVQAAFRAEFQNSDNLGIEVVHSYDALDGPFEIYPGTLVPAGVYRYPEAHFIYQFGSQRPVSGGVSLERGQFYEGTRTSLALGLGRGRVQITPQMTIEPSVSIDWVDLPQGRFTNRLVAARASYTLTPRMSAGALMQYNSGQSTFNTSVRLRWEYSPGSDLFVVYSDNRDTIPIGFPDVRSRGIVVKITRLFRM